MISNILKCVQEEYGRVIWMRFSERGSKALNIARVRKDENQDVPEESERRNRAGSG